METTETKTPDYKMFNEEGNKAVHEFLTEIHKTFWDKLAELKKKYPEADDTTVTEQIHKVVGNLYYWTPNE